jgi:hypothetical protein
MNQAYSRGFYGQEGPRNRQKIHGWTRHEGPFKGMAPLKVRFLLYACALGRVTG